MSSKILEQAKGHLKLAVETQTKQRERERKDLEFQVPENQWSEQAKRERNGNPGDSVGLDARPMISIPKLDQPVRLVMNQARAAHLGVNIHPISEDANREQAEIRQGLYRCIERDSHAQNARLKALERAVLAGWGAYRINTVWDDDDYFRTDKQLGIERFDQKIVIEPILYQDTVYFDPASTKPNYTDAEWAFVTPWLTVETFRRRYPKAKLSDDDFAALMKSEPLWAKFDGETKGVRIAEYFYKQHEEHGIALLSDGRIVKVDEVPDGAEVVAERGVDVVTLMRYELSPIAMLKESEWNGNRIPLIAVIGNELQPFDEERRFQGIIGPAKDSQRLFNWAASIAIEKAALEPKAPWLVAEGQTEGYKTMWQQSNRRNYPALIYKPTAFNGQPLPPPQRVSVDVSQLGPSMQLLQQADDFIQGATAVFDPALGNLSPKERSGKAILALQGQADASNSHYVANLAIAMEYEAEVIMDMMPRIYDRPGRIAYILDGEDNEKPVMFNAPYVTDPKTRLPQRVPEAGMDGRMAGVPKDVKHYDLSKGKYGYSVDIGRSYQTRLQQGADEIGQILQASPELMPLIGPIYFKFRDFPGAKEIADVLKKVQAQTNPGLQDEDSQTDQQKLKQQAMQLQQENEQLKGMLAKASQAIETDMAKQQATKEKAMIDAQSKSQAEATKVHVAELNAAAKLREQEMEAKLQILLETMRQEHEKLVTSQAQEHETGMARAQAGMQMSDAQDQRDFDAGEAGLDRETQTVESERDRRFGAEESQADRDAAERQAAEAAKAESSGGGE